MNFAMPYMIQIMREYTAKVDKLEQADQMRTEQEDDKEERPIMLEQPQLMLTAGPGMGGMPAAPNPYGAAPPGMYPQPGYPQQQQMPGGYMPQM